MSKPPSNPQKYSNKNSTIDNNEAIMLLLTNCFICIFYDPRDRICIIIQSRLNVCLECQSYKRILVKDEFFKHLICVCFVAMTDELNRVAAYVTNLLAPRIEKVHFIAPR